jgi:hypothetical protein
MPDERFFIIISYMPFVRGRPGHGRGVGEMEERERRVAPGQSMESFECVTAKEKKAVTEKVDRRYRTGRGLRPLNP